MEDILKKWYQLAIVILLILSANYFTAIVSGYERKLDSYHNVIKDQGNTIQELNNRIEQQKQRYNNTIIKIAENIKRNDSFLNIGGYNEDLPYDDKDYYEKILTGSSDFDKMLINVENFFSKRDEYLANVPNIWPMEYSSLLRITSPFGIRFNPFTGELTQHNAIDIAGPWRAQIVATADGVVKSHWIYHPEFGRLIIIEHGNEFTTSYAHLAESYVHEGMEVKKGDVIGLMGKSGLSKGIHLHYEVRINDKAVNPINYLRTYKE